MIKELSEALRRLINSLSLRPVATLGGILLIVALYIGYRSYGLLERIVISPHEESYRFRAQLESAELVNAAIENLAIDVGAHSVVIRQFHNGRHDLTGIPFTEATATFYTSKFDDLKTEEPLSASNRSLRRMWRSIDKPECILLNQGIDISTRRYMNNYSLSRVVICPLTNPLKYPIGTITIGLEPDNRLSDGQVLTRTHLVAKSVTGYLQNAVPEEELY